jgi:restriction endonuclease S subunit
MSVNLKKYIKDVCHIQTGLFAKLNGNGDVKYLQPKYFDEYGQLNTTLYPELVAENISQKHFLNEGDVLFAAKGTKNFATVFEDYDSPTVASTSFFIIRLEDKRLLPSYLAWILNSQPIQAILKGLAKGTGIPSISKEVLENLEIAIPSLEVQECILKITKLRKREKLLKQQIEALRETQIQQQIIHAIKTR